jgi:xanthine dehydrogenase accessory factor
MDIKGKIVLLTAAHGGLGSTTLDVSQWDAAVIMSHHLESDLRYMRALADAQGPHYIGLLGPTARRNRVVHALGAEAAGIESRLRGPVGLNMK